MLVEYKVLLNEKERREHKSVKRALKFAANKRTVINEYLKPILNYISIRKYSAQKRSLTSHSFAKLTLQRSSKRYVRVRR